MALWSGRFEGNIEDEMQRFGASLPVDKRMYAQDIQGSIAHARMLASVNVISQEDAEAIESGLLSIKDDIENGSFVFDIADEDIHMAIESELTRRIGDSGKRLHTGRSRNDQVALDTRLYMKVRLGSLMSANISLRKVLCDVARKNSDVVMPGYTHLQHAQPVMFAHHMLAYVNMFERDFKRLLHARDAADANPLGSAALAGTTYPLDREMTTELLGFSRTTTNSMDSVSDRDYLFDAVYASSLSCIHLSRLCEELVMWSSSEFSFITMSDSYSTGSSIMPQKKNPDFAELVRGKTGRVVGDLMALFVLVKSLPLAYNKDLQEDKEGAFDAIDTLESCYSCVSGMISTMKVNRSVMLEACRQGYMEATDIADYLVSKGLPFREAHEVVGNLVLECERRKCSLADLTLSELQAACSLFEEDVKNALDIQAIIDARNTFGATSSASVANQLFEADEHIRLDEGSLCGA